MSSTSKLPPPPPPLRSPRAAERAPTRVLTPTEQYEHNVRVKLSASTELHRFLVEKGLHGRTLGSPPRPASRSSSSSALPRAPAHRAAPRQAQRSAPPGLAAASQPRPPSASSASSRRTRAPPFVPSRPPSLGRSASAPALPGALERRFNRGVQSKLAELQTGTPLHERLVHHPGWANLTRSKQRRLHELLMSSRLEYALP